MPLTIRQTASYSGGTSNAVAGGCTVTSDGSILLHRVQSLPDAEAQIYKSTDRGESWSLVHSQPGSAGLHAPRFVHFPDGIVCIATNDFDNNQVKLLRSTNNGNTWSVVEEYPITDPTTALIASASAASYSRTSAFIGGFFAREDQGGINRQLAQTTNSGATWSLPANGYFGTQNGLVTALARATGGKIYLGNDRQNHQLSTDYGANWSALPGITPPPGFSSVGYWSAEWLTDNQLWVGGMAQGNASPSDAVCLWWSDDDGQTFTRVAASAVEQWPSVSTPRQIRTLRRLTKGGLIFGYGHGVTDDYPPLRVSYDAGATFELPAYPGGWNNVASAMAGEIALAPNGNLVMLIEVGEGGGRYDRTFVGYWT